MSSVNAYNTVLKDEVFITGRKNEQSKKQVLKGL